MFKLCLDIESFRGNLEMLVKVQGLGLLKLMMELWKSLGSPNVEGRWILRVWQAVRLSFV